MRFEDCCLNFECTIAKAMNYPPLDLTPMPVFVVTRNESQRTHSSFGEMLEP